MNLNLRDGVDLTDAIDLHFGGETFKVARLMLREATRIGPILPGVLNAINRRAAVLNGYPRGVDGVPMIPEADVTAVLLATSLTEEEAELSLKVILAGISRAHPHVTLEDLWELPARPADLIVAVNAVLAQSHLLAKEKGTPSPGGAGATSR